MKKSIFARIAAVAAAAGVGVSSLFASPADLVTGADKAPQAAVEVVYDAADQADAEDDGEESSDEKKKGYRDLLRQQILRIPAVVRVLVGLPLWAVGWAVTGAASVVWSNVLGPAAGAALSWLLTAALLFAVAVISVKALFPDVPFRKIVTRENILLTAAGTALLAVICAVLPLFLEDSGRYTGIVKFAGGLLILAVIVIRAKFGPDSFDRCYVLD